MTRQGNSESDGRWRREVTMLLGTEPSNMLNATRCGPIGAPVVVLVHAIGIDQTFWEAQVYTLSQCYEVVTYDLLGHGKSSRPNRGYSLDAMADDLARVVMWASDQPVHLVGLSLGGMIAQTYTLAHGDTVKSLTLIDTVATLTPAARDIMRQRASLARESGMAAIVQPTIDRWFTSEFVARRPVIVERARTTLLANDCDIHAEIWDAIARIDLAPRLQEIECPVQVLVGEHDATTPIAASQLIVDGVRHSRLHLLPGLSHMTPLEGPDQVNRLLLSFIGSQHGR